MPDQTRDINHLHRMLGFWRCVGKHQWIEGLWDQRNGDPFAAIAVCASCQSWRYLATPLISNTNQRDPHLAPTKEQDANAD